MRQDTRGRTARTRLGAVAGAVLVGLALASAATGAWAQAKPPLTVSINTDVTSIDPHKIYSGTDYVFFGNVFESLYGHDVKGLLAPALALSHTVDAAGLVYEFKLRPGVKFHDGSPFTADDVRFSWQRAADPATQNPRAAVIARNIKDVEILDPLTVRIALNKPDGAFLENMDSYWHIVPKAYLERVGNEEFAKKSVGTGPFMFVERRPREFVRLAAFEQHWGMVPKVGELTFRIVIDDQTRMAQLQTGEADINTRVPVALAARQQATRAYAIHKGDAFQNMFLVISSFSSNPSLKKPEVRKALNMAVDHNALLRAVNFGFGAPNELACHPSVQGCDVAVTPYGFDPRAARAQLEAAGFDFSRPLRFISYQSGEMPLIAQAVGQMLDRVGVKTTIEVMEQGAYVALASAKQKDPSIDLIIEAYPDYNRDPSGRLVRLFKTGETVSFISDPDLDRMLDQLNDHRTDAARLDHIRSLFKAIHDKALIVRLWFPDTIYAARTNIAWDPPANYWPTFWNVEKK